MYNITIFTFHDFTPQFNLENEVKSKPNPGFKLKVFNDGEYIRHEVIRSYMKNLYKNGYTHVANMPGDLFEITNIARDFKIIILDNRILKTLKDEKL